MIWSYLLQELLWIVKIHWIRFDYVLVILRADVHLGVQSKLDKLPGSVATSETIVKKKAEQQLHKSLSQKSSITGQIAVIDL